MLCTRRPFGCLGDTLIVHLGLAALACLRAASLLHLFELASPSQRQLATLQQSFGNSPQKTQKKEMLTSFHTFTAPVCPHPSIFQVGPSASR